MARPSKKTGDQKQQIVLPVLRGEAAAAEASRRAGVSEQSVHAWKRALLDSGRDGLKHGQRRRSSRELELEAENEELKAALRETAFSCGCGARGPTISPLEDLEMIRTDARLSVSTFTELIGIPRRTYTYRLARHRARDPAKGSWPAPAVDRIEPVVAK